MKLLRRSNINIVNLTARIIINYYFNNSWLVRGGSGEGWAEGGVGRRGLYKTSWAGQYAGRSWSLRSEAECHSSASRLSSAHWSLSWCWGVATFVSMHVLHLEQMGVLCCGRRASVSLTATASHRLNNGSHHIGGKTNLVLSDS
jgi:hypothetical protein